MIYNTLNNILRESPQLHFKVPVWTLVATFAGCIALNNPGHLIERGETGDPWRSRKQTAWASLTNGISVIFTIILTSKKKFHWSLLQSAHVLGWTHERPTITRNKQPSNQKHLVTNKGQLHRRASLVPRLHSPVLLALCWKCWGVEPGNEATEEPLSNFLVVRLLGHSLKILI